MIRLNGKAIEINHFPDGTLLLKESLEGRDFDEDVTIKWNFENNEELLALYFITNHVKNAGYKNIILDMPYIPNARQDRVKNPEDVFTLKYFAQLINSLGFKEVRVLDAHSNVSLALIDRVVPKTPKPYIEKVIDEIVSQTGKKPLMFYPDEGAGKRYSGMVTLPYCFGIKKRDWATGEIKGLTVAGETELINGSNVLIVDDICSYGGTFLHSANALKELGAADIYLFVSHCEKSVLDGKLYHCEDVKHIYTTDSIFAGEDDRITVLKIND
jgi:ribose-phosphate pyrophosphokinase